MGFNVINFFYFSLTIVFVVIGSLVNLIEPLLPTFISQSFRYGKFSYKGKQNRYIQFLEVPKSYFKHFYSFATFWSCWGLYLCLKSIILTSAVPPGIMDFLDLVAGGSDREVQVDSTSALIAIVLMSLQCTRRCYETWCVQVFSSKSKMNLSHYLVGYLHYFGVVVAILCNTEGFVRGTIPSKFSFSKLTILQYLCIFLFHFAWRKQYDSNVILANLRKDETGRILNERHCIPNGSAFKLITSPHMFFEILMYYAIWGLIPHSITWLLVVIWVSANQIYVAWFTHKWYLQNFPNYPKERYVILPFIL